MRLYYWKAIWCLIGYNVSSIERYSNGATCFERFGLKISQISLTAANLSIFHSCVLFCGLSKQMWPLRNQKRFLILLHQKQNDCHLRLVYQSNEDLLKVFIWSASIQTTHIINPSTLSVSLIHVYLLDYLKLSLHCKCATVSFILVFV